MNNRCFAVQGSDDDAGEILVWPKFTGLWVAPLRHDQRPSSVGSCTPIGSEPAEIESGVEAHNERIRLNGHSQHFLNKLFARVKADAVITILGCGCFRRSRKFSQCISLFRHQLLIVNNSLFERRIRPIAELAKSPETKRQSLVGCDACFAVKRQRVILPLRSAVLLHCLARLLIHSDRVRPNVDVVMMSHSRTRGVVP